MITHFCSNCCGGVVLTFSYHMGNCVLFAIVPEGTCFIFCWVHVLVYCAISSARPLVFDGLQFLLLLWLLDGHPFPFLSTAFCFHILLVSFLHWVRMLPSCFCIVLLFVNFSSVVPHSLHVSMTLSCNCVSCLITEWTRGLIFFWDALIQVASSSIWATTVRGPGSKLDSPSHCLLFFCIPLHCSAYRIRKYTAHL